MKFNLRTHLFALILLASAVITDCRAFSFQPLATYYSQHENYCATQTWSATQNSKGILYFGTSDGLLTFDGVRWNRYYIPGCPIIRSVVSIGERVYVGAYEEVGYFERDECGIEEYHSLCGLLDDGYDFKDDEFWAIVPVGKNVYFQSFRCILCYDGKTLTPIQEDGKQPLNLFEVNNKMYSQLIHGQLCEFNGYEHKNMLANNLLGNSDVVAVLGGDKSLMLCTEQAGLYTLGADGDLRRLPTDVDSELKENCVNRAIRMRNGTIVLGTLRNGIYAVTPDGRKLWHYNYENGLGNNTVLGITEDQSGNVWVMLDHGISLIHTGLALSFLKADPGERSIGMTYAIHRDDRKLYVGTNQGLYVYNGEKMRMESYDELKSQIWHIASVGNQIFVGGGTSSAILENGKPTLLWPSASTDLKRGRINNKDVIIESSYYALRIHRRQPDGSWGTPEEIKGFGAPVRQIEIDTDGSIWCSHLARGVIHLTLTESLDSVESLDFIANAGPGHETPTSFVMKIRGDVVVSDGDSLYHYDRANECLKTFAALHKDLPSATEIYSATQVDDRRLWLVSRSAYSLIEYRDGHYQRLMTLPLDQLTMQGNGVNNRVYVDDEQNCYFALNNGVGCLNPLRPSYRPAVQTMAISSVESIGADGSTKRLILNPTKDNRAECDGNIVFKMSFPQYNFGTVKFLYSLDGPTKMTRVTDQCEASFLGLKHGDYTLTAALLDERGKSVAREEYHFTVPRPGYLSYWAMSGYVLALAATGLGLSKIYTRRQMRRQKHAHEIESAAQNVKILEQERIIHEQQKQLLQNELDLKSRELATLALKAGYKDQVIDNLKETISGQRRKGLDSREIDNLIRKIDSDINRNEFWTIFDNNFDLIHENFFRNLRQRYPDLTPSDLKFCALMRLNMSTKDIAEFTHLTIRGVETARYRIRRKLGLETKDSIVQFLIDFK